MYLNVILPPYSFIPAHLNFSWILVIDFCRVFSHAQVELVVLFRSRKKQWSLSISQKVRTVIFHESWSYNSGAAWRLLENRVSGRSNLFTTVPTVVAAMRLKAILLHVCCNMSARVIKQLDLNNKILKKLAWRMQQNGLDSYWLASLNCQALKLLNCYGT